MPTVSVTSPPSPSQSLWFHPSQHRADRMRQQQARQPACFSCAPSVHGLTSFLFMVRIVLSTACENPSEPTTVRRTSYRSSQAEWYLHSYTGSWAFHPVRTYDLSQADGWRKSAVWAHLRSSQVVFMLLPALRKRRCPWCLVCDPFAPSKPTPL